MPFGRSFYDLRDTIAQRWHASLVGSGPKPRPHWTTKVTHYKAVSGALARAQGGRITWRDVTASIRPGGSASTFYDVAGRHGKHRLIDAYRNAGDANSLQIALEYHRNAVIDHLVDETKVWSYWEYREAYLRSHLDADRRSADGYLEALAAWASVNRLLAAALDCAPPMCAVEDLVALHRGGLAAFRARRLLTDVVRDAVRDAVRRPDSPATAADEAADPTTAVLYPRPVKGGETAELVVVPAAGPASRVGS